MGFGDDLMLAGEARDRRTADPRKVAARRGKGFRVSPAFLNNPHMATAEEIEAARSAPDTLQYLDESAGRRYIASATPERWTWTQTGPTRGDLYFTAEESAFASTSLRGRWLPVIIEPNLKPGASPNKDWNFNRWQALVDLAGGIPWLQIGAAGSRRLLRVPFLETPTVRHAAAILEQSVAAVLPEGGLHHAAAAVHTGAVVIFGGYISPAQTGYADHVNIFTGGEPCGMRVPCEHCKAAMARIQPDHVLAQLMTLFKSMTVKKRQHA